MHGILTGRGRDKASQNCLPGTDRPETQPDRQFGKFSWEKREDGSAALTIYSI